MNFCFLQYFKVVFYLPLSPSKFKPYHFMQKLFRYFSYWPPESPISNSCFILSDLSSWNTSRRVSIFKVNYTLNISIFFYWLSKFSQREFLLTTLVQEPCDITWPFSNDTLFLLHLFLFPCYLPCVKFSLHYSSVKIYTSLRLNCLLYLVDFPDHSRSC